MKDFLLEMFSFNERANLRMIHKISEIPDTEGAIKYLSHLINSQNKWLARIQMYPEAPPMSWWKPVYEADQLEKELNKSTQKWIDYLGSKTEEDLETETKFIGYDGSEWSAKLKDITLQLTFHSFHHRAQIQTLIRDQGIEPDFIDYIAEKYRRLN